MKKRTTKRTINPKRYTIKEKGGRVHVAWCNFFQAMKTAKEISKANGGEWVLLSRAGVGSRFLRYDGQQITEEQGR
jgi:hypothetical protein